MKPASRIVRATAFLATAVVIAAASVSGAHPQLIRYQGRLTDSAGVALTGTVALQFAIYDAESGGQRHRRSRSGCEAVDGGFVRHA